MSLTPETPSAMRPDMRPCVGIVVMNRDGLIWAGQRIDTPGAWQMPQGGIDPGEDIQTAALRELVEETSIPADAVEILGETPNWIDYDLPPHLLGKLWKGKYRGQTQKWVLMRFDGPDSLIRIDTEHPEFSEWAWLPMPDIVARIVEWKREVYREVADVFKDRIKTRHA